MRVFARIDAAGAVRSLVRTTSKHIDGDDLIPIDEATAKTLQQRSVRVFYDRATKTFKTQHLCRIDVDKPLIRADGEDAANVMLFAPDHPKDVPMVVYIGDERTEMKPGEIVEVTSKVAGRIVVEIDEDDLLEHGGTIRRVIDALTPRLYDRMKRNRRN